MQISKQDVRYEVLDSFSIRKLLFLFSIHFAHTGLALVLILGHNFLIHLSKWNGIQSSVSRMRLVDKC